MYISIYYTYLSNIAFLFHQGKNVGQAHTAPASERAHLFVRVADQMELSITFLPIFCASRCMNVSFDRGSYGWWSECTLLVNTYFHAVVSLSHPFHISAQLRTQDSVHYAKAGVPPWAARTGPGAAVWEDVHPLSPHLLRFPAESSSTHPPPDTLCTDKNKNQVVNVNMTFLKFLLATKRYEQVYIHIIRPHQFCVLVLGTSRNHKMRKN